MRTNVVTIASWAIIAVLLGLLTAPCPAFAEIAVVAQVDRTTVAPGESLNLQITINGGKGEADLSGLKEFKILSRGSSSNVQFINGQMSREVTYNYLLIPQRRGRLTIPALAVEVDGRIYHSDPIVITVQDQPAADGESPRGKEVWVSAEVSSAGPYQGQPFIYTFRLHNRVQIDDAKFQPPEFKGFSAKEIKDRRSYRKIINGREHVITEVYYILTPLAAGIRTIEPAVLQVGILRQATTRRQSPFDSFFNRAAVEPRVLQTEALNLEVLPLPPLPAGQKFSGLVGRFDLRAEIESPDLKVGDSATLAVTIEGRGNIMDAKPPEVQVPGAFKAYADTPQDEVVMDRTGFHGKKVFRTALVPLEAGRFDLPQVTMTYFDTERKTYQTLTAAAAPLTVAAAQDTAKMPVAVTPDPIRPLRKKVAFTGRDILPPKEDLDAIKSGAPLPWAMFLLGLAAPALAFAGTVWVQHLRRPDTSPAAVMKTRARQALKIAQRSSDEEFLTPLYQALTAAILAASGRLGQALTWKEAEALLLKSGRSPEEARRAAALLSEIESCKFSGRAPSTRQREALMARTHQTVRELTP